MKEKVLGKYKNGNTVVFIYEDGTRIIESEDDEFDFAYPTNIDVTITTKCDGGCPFCYMNCNEQGIHADLNQEWVNTIMPYTEVAINGNDLSHPYLADFLVKLKEKNVIVSMTVNQKHFMKNIALLHILVDNELIKGLGISLVNPNETDFIAQVKRFPNAVIHVINGILSPSDIDSLKNKELKLLILGYKHLRRGEDWYNIDHENIVTKQMWLRDSLKYYISKFKVISFDNLALKQLNVKELLSDEQWNEFYAGNDGTCSMFVDMVTKTFAKSSTTQLETQSPIMDNLFDMFQVVKTENVGGMV